MKFHSTWRIITSILFKHYIDNVNSKQQDQFQIIGFGFSALQAQMLNSLCKKLQIAIMIKPRLANMIYITKHCGVTTNHWCRGQSTICLIFKYELDFQIMRQNMFLPLILWVWFLPSFFVCQYIYYTYLICHH